MSTEAGRPNTWRSVSLVLLAALILTGGVAVYYYQQYTSTSSLYNDATRSLSVARAQVQGLSRQYESILRDLLEAYAKLQGLAFDPEYGEALSLYGQALQSFSVTLSNMSRAAGLSYRVNVLVDYGNGSRVWYNNTVIDIGQNAFNATVYATGGRVVYRVYPGMGPFITGINGVSAPDRWWSLWVWDRAARSWRFSETVPSMLVLMDGDAIAWHFVSFAEYPPPPPG